VKKMNMDEREEPQPRGFFKWRTKKNRFWMTVAIERGEPGFVPIPPSKGGSDVTQSAHPCEQAAPLSPLADVEKQASKMDDEHSLKKAQYR
jgi:hypothetical protein